MTGLSSEGVMPDKTEIAEMAADLFQAKIEAEAHKDQKGMTHMLRIGQFHLEMVPDKDINVEGLFKDILADLFDRYGEKILIKDFSNIDKGTMHG